MIKYTIAIEGNFITFISSNDKVSYRKQLVKLVKYDGDSQLVLVGIDNTTNEYKFSEVENPGTPGAAFISVQEFRDYIVTQLNS